MPVFSITSTRTADWDGAAGSQALTLPWIGAKTIVLIGAVVLAAIVRFGGLDTYGFSEDEMNKVAAIQEYRAGHFTANAEHPMLMKLAMWGSVGAAERWNRVAPPAAAMSLETALRLPNAAAGAATTAVLFGVADLLFGPTVAAAAAILWALDVNAIA